MNAPSAAIAHMTIPITVNAPCMSLGSLVLGGFPIKYGLDSLISFGSRKAHIENIKV